MYKKIQSNESIPEMEKRILKFWEENKILEKSLKSNASSEPYIFYDGPPTANGKPHIGHVLTRVIKDVFPRYYLMKGRYVPRKAGWDTHGLPVELEVEKQLKLNGKEQIEQYGIRPFIEHCKSSVWKYKEMWEEFSNTIGYWVDMDNPYITYDNDYIESVWWSLKCIFDKGLLYKSFKVVPYCTRCGTPLSSHEVAQGYKTVKEKSVFVRFKLKNENAFFVAWTTTPWTLPSNVALCVNPTIQYVKLQYNSEIIYIAEELVDSVLGKESDYRILEKVSGKDLEYTEYEPIYDFVSPKEKCFYVTCADYVSLNDGTGIVHIAPAFGNDDAQVGNKYNLPFVQLVDNKGNMTKETNWEGEFVKDVDAKIIEDLKQRGILFKVKSFEHNYPYCWRCDTPLLYYARESWFIKMTEVKDDLIKNNKKINWLPSSVGEKRFGNWIENVQDWGISRNRYWGTPLNIWQCDCGHLHAIGSIAELQKMSKNCPKNIELHRPFIDEVTIVCPKCGKDMKRVPEVIDCWYDSGAMPFAQYHYPFENREKFEKQFPADFISEAVDQTRGWFYSLLAISTLMFNKEPFKNVIVLGHVLDENGNKMSKSKGNAVDPKEAIAKFGADPIRWFFVSNSAPWLPNKFYENVLVEGQRQFLGTLNNIYAFYVLYAEIYKFNPTKYDIKDIKLSLMDRWILSKLENMLGRVDEYLSSYKLLETTKQLKDFVNLLSNWYVRRSRERFWTDQNQDDSIAAFFVLYTCLQTFIKIAAPLIPFTTENIYQNIVRSVDKNAPESVHLCGFPVRTPSLIDMNLEKQMDEVLNIVSMGREARNKVNIKIRQPLSCLYISGFPKLDNDFYTIIKSELNVKAIKSVEDVGQFVNYIFKPQLKTLGPRFGSRIQELRKKLMALDGLKAKQQLNKTGELRLNLSGEEVTLTSEDLIISVEQKVDSFVISEGEKTVVLDTNISEELKEEGIVRETISKIQFLRKENNFEVTDRINVTYLTDQYIDNILQNNRNYIMDETLAIKFIKDVNLKGNVNKLDINGYELSVVIEKNSEF